MINPDSAPFLLAIQFWLSFLLSFRRRRLSTVLVRLKFAEHLKEAITYIEQGHIRVGPETVTDPAFLVTRNMEDFITWVDTSKIKRKVLQYNDKLDDYDAMNWRCSGTGDTSPGFSLTFSGLFSLKEKMIITLQYLWSSREKLRLHVQFVEAYLLAARSVVDRTQLAVVLVVPL